MPRADGVSALVNSIALGLAGISRETPDSEGGRFERDLDSTPNDYVLANAMNVFTGLIPADTLEYLKENLEKGLQSNAALGWTQIQDAGMSYQLVELMKKLHAEGKMNHKVYAAVPVDEALREGIQIETHVIGDRAVRSLLNWYEEAHAAVPRSEWASEDLRWRMDHAQIIPPSDQQRFVELGVIASVQPSHGKRNLARRCLGHSETANHYQESDLDLK